MTKLLSNHPTRFFAALSLGLVALLAVLLPVGGVAITGAQSEPAPRLSFNHQNERLLDTRTGAKPTDGWTTAIQVNGNFVGVIDWQLNVQIVQADGDGWIDVAGQSAVVHDGGRANTVVSVVPDAQGHISVTVHGASTHVIVDLTRTVAEESATVTEPVDN